MTGKAKAGGSLVATLIGGIAVLLWSTLALLTVEADGLPRFQLLAMTFGIAFFCSLMVMLRRGLKGLNVLQQPWPAWALGVAALFLYHAVYFYALDEAPAIEAQMITFLWPLLIVLFSALAPGGRLRWFHLVGALLGFLGAGLLVGGGEVGFKAEFWVGYLLAALCALIWSSYSVVNRRFAQVPSETVGGFCGLVAVIGCFLHLTLEKTVVPDGGQWLAVLALGVGPVGLAFFVWDYGTKHGSLPALGAFSYAAPLISTLLLIAFGHAEISWLVLASAALVVIGALLAAQDLLFAKAKS